MYADVPTGPAHQIRIAPRPRGALVGIVGHDAGGAALLDRQAVHGGQRSIGEHDLAAHVLALAHGVRVTSSDVDELGGDIAIGTASGQNEIRRGSADTELTVAGARATASARTVAHHARSVRAFAARSHRDHPPRTLTGRIAAP